MDTCSCVRSTGTTLMLWLAAMVRAAAVYPPPENTGRFMRMV